MGEIFTAGNVPVMSHTKCVDIACKYVNKYIEDGIVKIEPLKPTDNNFHALIKNLI